MVAHEKTVFNTCPQGPIEDCSPFHQGEVYVRFVQVALFFGAVAELANAGLRAVKAA